ncbi:MAG: phage holin family protein [Chloroflexi bacterium]|nr:phage holin family protein [Chloroflexota bacterium]
MSLVWRALINAVAIFVAAIVLSPNLSWGNVDYGMGDAGRYLSLVLTGLVLGLVNAIVKPILVLLSLPITVMTLGLFLLVINGLMLWLVSSIDVLGFHVNGILWAIVGSIVISLVSFLLSKVLPD